MSADELKAQGNTAFQAGNFEEAVKRFGDAIQLAPDNHVLYSNRSASYASLKRYEEALEDAKKVTGLKADWPKGWSRLGAANAGLNDWDAAVDSYSQAVKLDPSNASTKTELEQARRSQQRAQGGGSGLGGMFGGDFLGRLAMNPRTRGYLSQPDFQAMLQEVQRDGSALGKHMQDPRFQEALSVGLGINLSTAGPGAAAEANGRPAAGQEEDMMDARPQAATPKPAPEPEPQVSKEEQQQQGAAAEAQKEKEAGNAAYKARQFEEALRHYDRALELNDKDISFLTNKAAVQFEQGNFDGCITTCDTAVERGRELRADYKQVAKALTRKGNALAKKGDLEASIEVYHKALTEHRNPDTLKKLNDTEKALKEKKQQEYINLDVSAEEREKGNQAFKEQRYPEAVQHYTEALARGPPSVNPEAHKLFSNRAACYTKLGAWTDGVKDADKCIELAPDFAKGYSRKGHLQFFMKEHEQALKTYEEGLRHDPDNQELKEGLFRVRQAMAKIMRGEGSEEEMAERRAKAMQDPEVQGILQDPVMRQVLQDLQEDPRQSQHHLSNPQIAAKLQKLVTAGIVRMG